MIDMFHQFLIKNIFHFWKHVYIEEANLLADIISINHSD